jgi:hypothetical protein
MILFSPFQKGFDLFQKLQKGTSILMLNEEIIYTVYGLSAPLRFFLFCWNFDQILELMKLVEANLKDELLQKSKKDFKKVKIVTALVALSLVCFYIMDFKTHVQSSVDVFDAIKNVLSFLCLFLSYVNDDIITFLLQFCFFNFCILIYYLFKQLEENIQELSTIPDEAEINRKIKTSVELHSKILGITTTLVSKFQFIIGFNFVVNIFFTGTTLNKLSFTQIIINHFKEWL